MGDDTPGHKADPTKRGTLARSKPDGLMYLALQTAKEEERQIGASVGASQGPADALGGVGGRMVGMPSMAGMGGGVGMEHGGEGGLHDGDMLGGGGKMPYPRRRTNKTSNRLMERKTLLSMRLKDHWKRKDDAAKISSKARGAGAAAAAAAAGTEGRSPTTAGGGDDARGMPASGFQLMPRRAEGGMGSDVQMLGLANAVCGCISVYLCVLMWMYGLQQVGLLVACVYSGLQLHKLQLSAT